MLLFGTVIAFASKSTKYKFLHSIIKGDSHEKKKWF